MTAHHAPCLHTHTWLARCFWAKWTRQEACLTRPLQPCVYRETFLCPECRAELKGEKIVLVGLEG